MTPLISFLFFFLKKRNVDKRLILLSLVPLLFDFITRLVIILQFLLRQTPIVLCASCAYKPIRGHYSHAVFPPARYRRIGPNSYMQLRGREKKKAKRARYAISPQQDEDVISIP